MPNKEINFDSIEMECEVDYQAREKTYYVKFALFTDGTELTKEELEELNDDSCLIYDLAYERY